MTEGQAGPMGLDMDAEEVGNFCEVGRREHGGQFILHRSSSVWVADDKNIVGGEHEINRTLVTSIN